MYELYQDAMAIVGKFGKPDLFVTFTCNPNWPEIQNHLLPGQTAWDRPDLVCRVFKMKMDEFLNDLTKKMVFGKVKAGVWVVEFQKRGLPHCHCLLIMENEFKLKTTEQVDRAIWAEIPDKDKYPVLHERVIKHMIHLPCNSEFRKCQKKNANQCNKNFPKAFQAKTTLDSESYPKYRRREQKPVIMRYAGKEIPVTNRYVVPYNPYLLLKFNAHVNVEVCNTVSAVKYLYKYIYKGYDRAIVKLDHLDEISNYENYRYVSSVEAYWRMKANFKISGRFPAVIRLPVHLKNEHEIYFSSNANLKEKLKQTETKFTQWFELNKEYPQFKDVLYFDIPKFFTWKKDKWVIRAKNKLNKNRSTTVKRPVFELDHKIYEDLVVRSYTVTPRETERFFLNTILRHRPGATSFEDLRTVNGVTYSTYQQTASKLGLLADDEIWFRTLEEAVLVNLNPNKLRQLFAHLLLHCEINKPFELWAKFKNQLGDDFKRTFPGQTQQQFEQKVLNEILRFLVLRDDQKGSKEQPHKTKKS